MSIFFNFKPVFTSGIELPQALSLEFHFGKRKDAVVPDQFGGVELEDEFGGVIIEDEPATPPPPRFNDELIAALPERDRRQLELRSELAAERGRGEKLQAETEELARQEASIERFTPTGILNQPERFMRTFGGAANAPEMPERFQAGQPVFPIEAPQGTNAMAGLGQLGVGLLNTLQTPEMIVTAPAMINPVGRALMGMEMGKEIPGQIARGAEVVGDIATTPAEKVVATGEPIIAAGMTALLSGQGQVRIPPQIRATIEQSKTTLPKAAAAAEEAVVKKGATTVDLVVEEKLPTLKQTPFDTSGMTPAELLRHEKFIEGAFGEKPIEVTAKSAIQKAEGAGVELRQEAPAQEAPLKPRLVPVLETASGKLYPGPSHTKAAEAARAKINSDFAEGKITREEFIKELTEVLEADEAVDTQHKMLDLNTGKTVEQGPGRVQSFNLDPKETAANLRELQDKGIAAPKVEVAGQMIDRINQLPVEEAVKLNQRPEMYRELGLKPEDASALQKASDNAFARFEAFLDAGNEAAAQAEMGRGVFFNGAIEWANKKGPNYERGIAETAAPKEAPTPQLAAQGVGAIPENVPTARPATAQEGVGGSQKQPWQMSNDEFFDKVVSQRSSVVTTEGKVITGTDHGDARLRAEEMGLNVGKGEELGQRAGWKAFGQNILASELETGAARKRIIEQALKEGKPVPPEVLADYPNLQAVRQSESPQRAVAFLERESEAQGLGRSSLPPTVADVRAARPAAQWQLKPDPEAKHRQIVISKSGSNLGTVGLTPKGDWRVFGDPSPKRFKSAEAAADQLITDLHPGLGKQNPYFDRQSEAQGLGELSTPPTVADVRAQRARDTGAPPPVEPPKPSAAASPAPGPRGTLDDVYGIFETDPKPSPTIKQRVIKASEAFRTGLSSSFRPLNKLVEDVAKQYGLPLKKADLSGLFEQLKGSSGKAEADIYRFDQDVSKLVKGSEKDFNAHLFLRRSLDRLEQDAARGETRRAVSGYTIPELQSKLATLEAKLTPEQRASFKTAADSFQRHMDEALKLQVDSGRMSPEVYTAIKEGNQFYAPFKVMKYLEETARPAGTGRRIDTPASFVKAMEGIESPDFKLGDMLAAARQNISLSRVLAEKNKAMQNFTDLAALDTEGLFLKKLKSGQEAPQGMEAVNVFENGVQERYVVNPDVATAVQVHGPQSGTLLARIAGNIFRAGATTFNLPFQVSNLMADIPRQALVSKYGLRGVTDLVRYPLDFAESVFSSFAGNFGIKNKLYLDFLDSGVAGSTVQQYLTPDALRFKPETAQSKTKAFAKSVLNTIPEFTNAIEQVSKIVGVKRAMRFEGKETGAQLAREIPEAITEIRRFSGSPDFGRSGKWTDQARLNLLYMFFNARVQGTIADVGRLTGRDGAGMARKTWFKVGTAIGLPTVYVYLMNNSDEYKEDYAKRPEQEKRNYWLIPKDSFITNSTGEKMRDYWRIPKRESAKWVGNFVEAGMEFAQERDPKHFAEWGGTMLEEVFPVNIQGDTAQQRLESMGASLNPVIKAPLEVATGRDMYRHRNIVPKTMEKASPELQYTDRTAEVFKKLGEAMPDVAPEVFRSPLMLENMTKNMTAGLITQFLPRKPVEGRSDLENTPLGARFQAVPYTDSSEFDERMDKLERETADEQLTRFRNADKLLKENKDAGLKVLVQKSIAAHGPDRKQVEKVVDLWTAEQRGITPQERRIMALPTQQRAEFIIGELTGKTPEQRAALIRTYAIKRILTEGVAEQMIAQGFK